MTTHPTPRRTLFTVALCCLLPQSTIAQGLPRARPEDVGLSATALERIAPTLQSYVDSGQFPGFLAVIARHGKLAYLSAGGWMDVEHRRAMIPDAVFRIYSLTKPIASTAVMQLYERGTLRLDDPVSKYIPAFAAVKVYASGGAATPVLRDAERPMTLADLLTHTSGLTYGFIGPSCPTAWRTSRWHSHQGHGGITATPSMSSPGSSRSCRACRSIATSTAPCSGRSACR